MHGRVRAPELRGAGGWLNTGGRELSLAGLRGRIVLLDFWTSACANCLHVIDELRPLEERYGDVLTTVGVHSPKFPHEAEHASVVAAVRRYGVRHPVLDDPDLATWRQYAVNAWPTLVLVDPDGYVVATFRGEGHAAELARLIDELVAEHGSDLRRGTDPEPAAEPETTLRFPGGIARTAAGTLLVADTGHHSVVELAADGVTPLRRIGTGERGRADGAAPGFAEPQGVAVLPPGALPGVDVLVADTGNHLIRGVRLDTGEVSTVLDLPRALAGATTVTGPVPPVFSPWDVAWWDGGIAVAAAGVHLLVSATGLLAGTTVEGLRDGPALDGWLAQPSGLAPDGATLWFVDAETSSLRTLRDGELATAVGAGLFDYGLVDGPAEQARFQHPLGVTLLPDGTVAVLDTYNGAVRRYDPVSRTVDTLARDLAEPTGAVVVGDELVVVESAAHRLTRIPLRRTVDVGPGEVTVTVAFTPPPGETLDDRYGPPTSLSITGLADGASQGPQLSRRIRIGAEPRLRVSAYAASCDRADEHPACHLARRDWDLRVVPGGPTELRLALG
jgi:thiol-disulfide isomerase/thioredoxin